MSRSATGGVAEPRRLIVLGARGSRPTPAPDRMRYGGNTTSFALPLASTTLVVDAGTGIASLGQALVRDARRPRTVDLLFSHLHLDHVQGLPAFAPFYDEGFQVRIHRPAEALADARETLRRLFSPPLWPIGWDALRARVTFVVLPGALSLDGVTVTSVAVSHPGGARAYRIDPEPRAASAPSGVVILTDAEHPESGDGLDREVLGLCRGAFAILYDAHFTPEEYEARRGWGHSTWERGVALARAAGCARLILVHHAPERIDSEIDRIVADARGQRDVRVDAASEGMTIPLVEGAQ